MWRVVGSLTPMVGMLVMLVILVILIIIIMIPPCPMTSPAVPRMTTVAPGAVAVILGSHIPRQTLRPTRGR
jgi:hypothetical protein